jgi:hypothetical protein
MSAIPAGALGEPCDPNQSRRVPSNGSSAGLAAGSRSTASPITIGVDAQGATSRTTSASAGVVHTTCWASESMSSSSSRTWRYFGSSCGL